eukprot:2262621-Pleurochrysis_carterae.AAC.1
MSVSADTWVAAGALRLIRTRHVRLGSLFAAAFPTFAVFHSDHFSSLLVYNQSKEVKVCALCASPWPSQQDVSCAGKVNISH